MSVIPGVMQNSSDIEIHINSLYQQAIRLKDTCSVERHAVSYVQITDDAYGLQQKVNDIAKSTGLIYEGNIFTKAISSLRDFALRHIIQSPDHMRKGYLRDQVHEIQAILSHVIHDVSPKKREEMAARKKWVSLGFPREAIEKAPRLISLLYASGTLFSMKGFSQHDNQKLGVRTTQEGGVEICYEGKYVPVEDFQRRLLFSQEDKLLYIMEGEEKKPLTYVSPPRGFIHLHPWKFEKAVHVAELTQEELQKVKAHAAKWKKELAPGDVKGVLQICTRLGRGVSVSLPKIVYHDENVENVPSHYFFRIIDNEGKVYSFGACPSKSPPFRTFLTTLPGTYCHVDYMEFRPGELVVTSVPLASQEKIQEMLQEVENTSTTFNFFNSNCTSADKKMLQIAGVDVETKMSVGSLLSSVFRKPIRRLPVIGHVARAVDALSRAITSIYTTLTPKPVQRVVTQLSTGISHVTSRVSAVFWSSLVAMLGGTTVHPRVLRNPRLSEKEKSPILSSWKDWFDPRATLVSTGIGLLKWQKAQSTTEFLGSTTADPHFRILSALEEKAK